jgi:hypothetical protein
MPSPVERTSIVKCPAKVLTGEAYIVSGSFRKRGPAVEEKTCTNLGSASSGEVASVYRIEEARERRQ